MLWIDWKESTRKKGLGQCSKRLRLITGQSFQTGRGWSVPEEIRRTGQKYIIVIHIAAVSVDQTKIITNWLEDFIQKAEALMMYQDGI